MTDLLTRDYSKVPGILWEIVVDPASRPREAMLLFGLVVVLAMLFLVIALLVIQIGAKDEDEDDSNPDPPELPGDVPDPALSPGVEPRAAERRKRRVPLGLVVVLTVAAWWLATGITTANTSVCMSCHADSVHATTQAENDPHWETQCVRCHESGGRFGALTTAVPQRVTHIATALQSGDPSGEYGFVGSDTCTSCHESDIAQTTTNTQKSVRMSHVEPTAAGAQCLDCHRAFDGVIGVSTTKMQPCLRCHNDVTVSADCTYCHTGDISLAVAGRSTPSTSTARALVPNPQCGGCHSQETCDACHGLRMPHTTEFMAYAHAREGVEDIWFNGGKTCGKCHSADRRPCTDCHKGTFPSHGLLFGTRHSATTAVGRGCDSCHGEMAYRNGRDFCVDLCHAAAQP